MVGRRYSSSTSSSSSIAVVAVVEVAVRSSSNSSSSIAPGSIVAAGLPFFLSMGQPELLFSTSF